MSRRAWSVPIGNPVSIGIVAIGLVAGAVGIAAAQDLDRFRLETTGDLLEVCAPGEGSGTRSEALYFCHGFIRGTGQLYQELVRAGSIKKPWSCVDPAPRMAEIREAFVSWAKAHPEHLKDRAVDGFWRAMSDKWPCRS